MNVINKDIELEAGDGTPLLRDAVPGDLLPGDKDPNGRVVTDIFWTTEKYQIYLANNEVRYLLEREHKKAAKLRKALHDISGEREIIEYRRKHRAIGRKDRTYCARLLARCMAQAFEGNTQSAKAILEKLDTRLSTKIQSHFRMRYVVGSGLALVVLVALFLAMLAMSVEGSWIGLPDWMRASPDVVDRYAKLCIFGALGAFLSVSIGIRNISFDLNLSAVEHIYAGGIRIIIGVIGAIVVGLALDSELIAPSLAGAKNASGYYLMAFLAGFSETLVPNVLRKVEKTQGGVKGRGASEADPTAS